MKHKLAKALIALGLGFIFTVTASTPAQAVTYHWQECNWPNRAAANATGPAWKSIAAYSFGGTYLGGKSGWGYIEYSTPWEDVEFRISGTFNLSDSWCYR